MITEFGIQNPYLVCIVIVLFIYIEHDCLKPASGTTLYTFVTVAITVHKIFDRYLNLADDIFKLCLHINKYRAKKFEPSVYRAIFSARRKVFRLSLTPIKLNFISVGNVILKKDDVITSNL